MSTTNTDILIVGGGILGCATAIDVASLGATVVLEKEPVLAAHQTGHNSGVIHAGLYYKPGSMKATACALGRERLVRFCEQHDVPFEACGKVVVALTNDEVQRLDELERRGRANGLSHIRRASMEEIREREPHVAGIDGLIVPETGIVDYRDVTAAYAAEARRRDVKIDVGVTVRAIVRDGSAIVVETDDATYRTRCLVGCAGLGSDRLARLAGVEPGVQIVPFRGEYYELVPARRSLVRHLIYPVPDPSFPFLGVHFTRRIGGQVEAGPNAVLALQREGYHRSSFNLRDATEIGLFAGTWKLAAKHWRTGLGELWRSWSKAAFVTALRRLLPDLEAGDLTPAAAGVRAQAMRADGTLVDDFHIVEAPGMVHVLNAPSPAATASLAISETIAQRVATHLR